MWLTTVLGLLATVSAAEPDVAQTLALLLPDNETHTKLVPQPEALKWLASLSGPVAVVAVVGAYRTGKSWLLNELMRLPCTEGFVVGHRRQTQTKGVWVSRRTGSENGTTVIYMDTEGFDGTGQADVYDDRILAFATLVSSVLVYNLAETIKQQDIERLAFASQLSREFWRRAHGSASLAGAEGEAEAGGDGDGGGVGGGNGGGGGDSSSSGDGEEWSAPALLWLVQRDFLEGSSVQEYLKEALQTVPNPSKDEHARRLNQVRETLRIFRTMAGMGLVQPHLKRTELCKLDRRTFDPDYLKGYLKVEEFVRTHAAPKTTAFTSSAAEVTPRIGLDGPGLSSLAARLARVPSTSSAS